MYEFHCAYCGTLKRVYRPHDASRFCSKSCAARWRAEHKRRVKAFEIYECVYQPESIICDGCDCSKCGWNPDVAKARLEAITGK